MGTHATANSNAVVYHWIAFRAVAGQLEVGTYTGNGDRQPLDHRRRLPARLGPRRGTGIAPTVHALLEHGRRPEPPSRTGPGGANRIQAFEADGFQVGSDADVNGTGDTFHYAAWKAVAGRMARGTYTGRRRRQPSIAGVGFEPEYVIVKSNFQRAAPARHKSRSTGAPTDTTLLRQRRRQPGQRDPGPGGRRLPGRDRART